MEKGKITSSIYYRWFAIFCLVVVGFISLGIFYYHYEADHIRDKKYDEIAAIAKLKADSIQDWRRSRLADVKRASTGYTTKREMARLLQNPTNPSTRAILQILLNINKKDTVYADAFFLYTKGHILQSDNPNPPLVDQATMKAMELALKDRKGVLSDFFRDPEGIIYIDAVAPIPDNAGQPMAIMVLRSKAAEFLYPLIQSWPTPSKTAETLLVCREGDSVLFLNELRHRSNTALTLRFPLTDTTLPAVQAVLGKYGKFFGRDYRGLNVLAVTQPVPDSSWSIVAKVDADEVLAEVKYRAWAVSIIIFLLILIAAGLMLGIYRNRQEIERKRAAESLSNSEGRLRTLVQTIPDLIWLKDKDGVYLSCNPMFERFFGAREADIIGKTDYDFVDRELADSFLEHDRKAMAAGKPTSNEEWITFADDGNRAFLETIKTPMHDSRGTLIGVLGIGRDITERKRTEEALRESEERSTKTFRSIPDALVISRLEDGKIVEVNDCWHKVFGYSREEVIGKNSLALNLFADSADRQRIIALLREHGFVRDIDLQIRQKSGALRTATLSLESLEIHGDQYLLTVVQDITERKQAEEELKQSEERYRSIFENAQEGIFRSTPDGRILMANQAMAKMFGYESPEEGMASITDVAHQLYVNPEDRRKIEEMIEEHGFIKGYEAQSYRKDGRIIWISLTMHAVRDEKGQSMYYDGIIEDITDRKQAAERIRKALGATVRAIAVTVETRDPYTAGHQQRVANLARSIATEMNLPIDQIDGIRMAATIHDLGKISVPAEILSTPKKLTNIEFSLIKTHSQSGYDILKDIDFPWPIARMILEHHERMNGSGYPNGLTGDHILLESRILAVADVVEAMASHRPYRPGLGIDLALAEIEMNKGIFYDNAVADACLRLFREKGFQLEAHDFKQ